MYTKYKNCYGIFIDITYNNIEKHFQKYLDKSLIFCILRV